MQKSVRGYRVGERYADGCGAFGAVYQNGIKVISHEFKFVVTPIAAFALDVTLIL